MAIAVPVATKLVQENQDTRNRAATCKATGASCSTGAVPCCSGKCSGGKCVANSVSPTSRPAATATPKPSCGGSGQWCDSDWMCCAGLFCNSNERCQKPLPTNIPTTKPSPTPTPVPCKKLGQSCSGGGCCSGLKCSGSGYGAFTCIASVTATPTPSCGALGGSCISRKCCTGLVCSGGDYGDPGAFICVEPAVATPTKRPITPTGTVPIVTTTPVPSDKCPGTQACPDSTGKVLRDCKNPDSDGTSRDAICSKAGQKDSCGGKEYCCPSAGGVWTTDMTKCPTSKCVQCSGKPNAKASGDANCDDKTNLIDYSIWREEYLSTQCGNQIMVLPTWKADFNCDGLVDLADYTVWRNNYFLKTFK